MAASREQLFARSPLAVGALREGLSVARGEVLQVVGPLAPPVALPPGLPPLAALSVEVEHRAFLARPIRERFDRARPFVLRDAGGPGRALVRLAPPEHEDGRLGDDVELALARPFAQSLDGGREVIARAVAVGDEVVVVGAVHFEVNPAGAATYRELPALPVIDATALFDPPAWESVAAWHALPWYRKLSVIVRNR